MAYSSKEVITTRFETPVEFVSASGDFKTGEIFVKYKRLTDGIIKELPVWEFRTEGGLPFLIEEAKRVRV